MHTVKHTSNVAVCGEENEDSVANRLSKKGGQGQVRGLHAILSNYSERVFSLPQCQRSRLGSNHLPSLSNQDGPICDSARSASGRQRHRAPLCMATFLKHILWMRNHTSAPAIERMNHTPCWL